MSGPPVDPRTESDEPRPAPRLRVRSVARRAAPSIAGVPDARPVGWVDDASGPITGMTATIPGAGTGTGTGYSTSSPTAVPMDPSTAGLALTTPAQRRFRIARRPRVRKVSRVVKSIDAWSVFKISIIFYLAMYVVVLVAGVLLWNVAYSTGTIDNISSFFESFGWKSFEFKGGQIFHNAWIIGLFLVAGLTGVNVVMATLYNLLTDLVGGVRVTVLEEEVVLTPPVPGAPPVPTGAEPPRPGLFRRRV